MSKTQVGFLLLVLCGLTSAVVVYFMAVASDPPISLKGVPLEVLIYQKGSPARVGSLSADSEGVAAIEALLKTKSGRWSPAFASYVPGILIRSNKFHINIQSQGVIVNYKRADGINMQVMSDLTGEEFERASKAISESFLPKSVPR